MRRVDLTPKVIGTLGIISAQLTTKLKEIDTKVKSEHL